MRWVAEVRERLAALLFPGRRERELDEEMRFHLEKETERLVEEGLEPEEARRRAAVAFGGVERFKEETRDATGVRWIEDAIRDVAHAVRTLWKRPGFTAAVVATLALGIGGTTAVYTVVRGVLLEPLPYHEPEELVRLYQQDVEEGEEELYVTAPHFLAYREDATSFEALATVYTYADTGADLSFAGTAERIRVLRVSSGYFRVLAIGPREGRIFRPEDEAGAPVAILSEHLARRLGPGGAPGEKIVVDGEPRTIVGVMPPDTEDPLVGRADLWIPEHLDTELAQSPGNHFLSVVGRLAPGMTPEEAREEMAALDRALAEIYPDVADDTSFHLVPLEEDLVRRARPALLMLLGAVGIVLLIACVNVANLMIVRSLSREEEVAVRSALGATPGRLARQFLTESVVLAGVGGTVGLVLAWVATRTLVSMGRDAIPRVAEVAIDGPVLLFTAGVAVVVGILFGLGSTLRLVRTAPGLALRRASPATSGDRRLVWTKSGLVVAQVALALVLLVGASVLGASVYKIVGLDLGIRPHNVLTFELNLPEGRYDGDRRGAFHRGMTDRLGRMPGVRAVGATSWLPASGPGYDWGTRPLTGPLTGENEVLVGAQQRIVSGGFFAALGIPLLEGRVFDERDGAETTPVAVVSESLAERLFPGISALGQEIRMGGIERRVVGVVGDVAVDAEGTTAPHVYHLHRQFSDRIWAMKYLVASETGPEALLASVRREVADVDPELVVHEPRPLEDVIALGSRQRRFTFVVSAVFAGTALVLTMIGLYGVLAYLARRRRREISIRLALGADPIRMVALVVRQGLVLVGAGLVIGWAASRAVERVLESLTFRTEPGDPRILALAALALVVSGTAAALVPALRIARTPVREALVEE